MSHQLFDMALVGNSYGFMKCVSCREIAKDPRCWLHTSEPARCSQCGIGRIDAPIRTETQVCGIDFHAVLGQLPFLPIESPRK